jgi:hypothetical protein
MALTVDAVAELVVESRCIEVSTRDLLAMVGRARWTPVGWAAVNTHLAPRRLEAMRRPALPSRAWVYHRESAVAATLEAVTSGAPEGTAVLQALGAPSDASGRVRDLAELLRWHECYSLEELTDSFAGDADTDDLAVSLLGDDTYSFNLERPERLVGVVVNDGKWHIPLIYPFDPRDVQAAFDEIDRIYDLQMNLEILWEEYEDVSPDTLLQYMCLTDMCQPVPFPGVDERLRRTLVSRDDRQLPVARFLASAEVLFRLSPLDVQGMADRVRIYKSRSAMRVVAPAEDVELCGDLLVMAAR